MCVSIRIWQGNRVWAFYQIRKIVGYACTEITGNLFPATDFKGNRLLAIPACITARASRTGRDACRDRKPAVADKTFPAFPAHAQPSILRIWREAYATAPALIGSTTLVAMLNHYWSGNRTLTLSYKRISETSQGIGPIYPEKFSKTNIDI